MTRSLLCRLCARRQRISAPLWLLSGLLFLLGPASHAERHNPNTDWFRDAGWGVFVHYLWDVQNVGGRENTQGKPPTNWNALVAEFDTEKFADQVKQTGAPYVFFTMMQRTRYLIAPNATYDKLTGYPPGEACATRDVVLDLHRSLDKRGIKLMLYWTGDGPRQDTQAAKGMGGWNGKVTDQYVQNWADVAAEYSQRYGDKVKGWWVDGCYGYIGYNEPRWQTLAKGIKSGNPRAIIALNNPSMSHANSLTDCDDFTTGEVNQLSDIPDDRWRDGKQFHVLSFLGADWGKPGCRYDLPFLADYISQVNAAGGVVTIDIALFRDGSLDPKQVKLLSQLGAAIKENRNKLKDRAAIPPGNLACWKPAKLLSLDGSHTLPANGGGGRLHSARLGVDGDPATDAQGSAEWPWTYEVDLQQPAEVGRVVITFGKTFATHFQLQLSADGKAWKTIADVPAHDGGKWEKSFAPTQARFVRVRGLKPDGPNQPGGQMSIAELEVYAAGAPAQPAPKASPGRTTYFIDPAAGNDSRSGTTASQAWRSFGPLSQLQLAPGDRVEIKPGRFTETLSLAGGGSAEAPVEIRFAPGRYDFFLTNATRLQLHISNNNDDPNTPKAVALLLKDTRHFRVTGDRADVFIHGKMIEVMLDHAEDVTFTGLSFDYARPTVSEFTVLQVSTNAAEVQVHADSTYTVENGKLAWIGEGWRSAGLGLTQECDPTEGRVWRRDSPLRAVTKVEELAVGRLRLSFTKNPGFVTGRVFQFRETFRDCCGAFVLRSRDITFRNCAFHFMHGLGVVSQLSENLTFDHVALAPRPGSGRTCAGWADLLHFSGCRGQILVTDCEMSGTNDDPINVHGTHLRIVDRPAPDQVRVRFMHPQSYGFEAFVPGDEIEFVSHVSLCAYATNRVMAVEAKGEKEILLTLAQTAPEQIGENDVVENVTWTPAVTVRNCQVALDSCRGFLLTTRRPILVESNTFTKTTMHAILIADDANSWFESGPVHDVTIRGNRFVRCAEPVIAMAPENHTAKPEEPVHRNIRIVDNWFDLSGRHPIAAKSTRGLTITGNRFSAPAPNFSTNTCSEVKIENNQFGVRE